MKKTVFLFLCFLGAGCSPLKSSPYGEGYQLELTLHEVKTNLEDVKHELHSFAAEMHVFDARIKHYEDILSSLKHQDLGKQQLKLEQLASDVQLLERKWTTGEKNRTTESDELRQLSSHTKQITAALGQCKNRIEELEKELTQGQRKFEELGKLKGNIESLAKVMRESDGKFYKVRSGDSLEKIAKFNKTTVDKIKKLNGMDQDLIVVGQEIKIPNE